MKTIAQVILQIIWPPAAPIKGEYGSRKSRQWWIILCIITVIPLTAAFHHLVFYRPTCILALVGPDYTPSIIFKWLSRDPSLPWAILIMILVYYVGNFAYRLKTLVAPVFISFLPLSVWIWDIPFTGRLICTNFHDNRVMITEGLPLRSKYFYLVGIIIYLAFTVYMLQKQKKTAKSNLAS